MKKFLFVFTILLWSGLLILLSFSKDGQGEKVSAATIDFSEGEKLLRWDNDIGTFTETNSTESKTGEGDFYLHRLSPIDGIYYRSDDIKPFVLEKKGRTNIISFWSGLFVCNIQTGLERYEFRLSDLEFSPKGRGIFLVDNRSQPKIYSFDSFLDISFINEKNQSKITNFTLFPSLLFTHNPKNTPELKEADILRISLIDFIRYADMETAMDRKIIFSGTNEKKDEQFLEEVRKDITDRIHAFVELFEILRKKDGEKESTSFFGTSSALLINGSKKELLLKNILLENILWLIRNPSENWYKTVINDTISEMKELNGNAFNDGLFLLRQYYFVTTFSRFTGKDKSFDFSKQESPLLFKVEEIMTGNSQLKRGEYHMYISDLFSAHSFLSLEYSDFNSSFERILSKILDNKTLSENEFLPFAFFVTQYLSNGPILPNEATLLIISHLFRITDDYYINNKDDIRKLDTIISTAFYNYNRIFAKIYTVFIGTYIDKTQNGLLLKEKYVEGGSARFERSFLDTLSRIINMANDNMDNKKNDLMAEKTSQLNSQIIDNYSLLKNTLKSFNILISMLNNYPKYLNDFHLNEQSKRIRGILIEKKDELSMGKLRTYLKTFNNIDISSLWISNDFQEDGYYEFQIKILGNHFNLRLWEQGHVLTDISYVDTFGKKHVFPNITIPLDQKKEQLDELKNSSDDPKLRYKYDFKNFFEITFLRKDLLAPKPSDEKNISKDILETSPEIRLFIQKELIEKDFKNIEDFLPIGFKNISVSIDNGNYIITLKELHKNFSGEWDGYITEMSGKYTFNRHNFSQLTFRVKRDGDIGWYEFGGVSIEVLPARISLLSFSENLRDLGYYIDAIRLAYDNQQSIIVDLTEKKVLLDNVPFFPKFPTP